MNFGHWITSPQLSRNCVTADPPSPAPLFRRAFECSGFTTGRVRLSGVGYHELYLNGRKVGDRVLDPAVSCYEKRVRFVTFDITEYLHPGTNVVGVILGNGWYNPSTAEVWNFFKAPWRDCVKFTIELEIDGQLVLGADESWKCTSGPILFDALRNGETYDARCEIDGWLGERYDDSGWLSAVRIAGPGGMLDEPKMPPCKVLQIPYCAPYKNLGFNLGTATVINYAHAHDMAVQYWTVNDPEDMAYLVDLGADCIMSDYPDKLYDTMQDKA